MSDYRVPPGCTGLTFQDGTRAEANRDGRVVVDERHARAIEKADATNRIHRITAGCGGMPRVSGRECRCGFMAYRWQAHCPKCGANLEGAA